MPGTMKDLLAEQDANSINLQKAISNYKKSPADRKTLSYVEQKLAEINALWAKFQALDRHLRIDVLPDDHAYFKQYDIIREKCSEVCEKMEAELAILRKEANPTAGFGTASPGEALGTVTKGSHTVQAVDTSTDNQKLRKILQMVQQMLDQVLGGADAHSTQFYAMKLKTIEQHWMHGQMLHEKLITSNDSMYDFDAYLEAEEKITTQLVVLQEKVSSAGSHPEPSEQNMRTQPNSLRLPQIDVPKFDGNYLQWRQFHDMFYELVHNANLPPCQKFIYLKSSLSGEARALIAHFSTTTANYNAAWQVLTDRYENKRIIVNSVISKLLSQPHLSTENAQSVKALHDVTNECMLSLENLGIATSNWDPIILHILIQRLSKTTQSLWEQSLRDPRELPNLEEFLNFLKLRFQSLEAVTTKPSIAGEQQKRVMGASATFNNNNCIICKNNHPIYNCPAFLKLAPAERLQKIQELKRCVNCLKHGHLAKQCGAGVCLKCKKKHNTLVHLETKTNSPEGTSTTTRQQAAVQQVALASTNPSTKVLLTTVRLAVANQHGGTTQCRAILDNGSQANFITRALVNKLGLRSSSCDVGVEGIGRISKTAAERVNVEISSLITGFKKRIEAYVLKKIVSHQPQGNINIQTWAIPDNISLADKAFNESGPIDILLGAGTFYSLLCVGQISLGAHMPILQNSLVGWLVGGEYKSNEARAITCGICTEDITLTQQLEKFWQLEENVVKTNTLTTSERRTETYFLQNLRRAADGRYVVRLPYQGLPTELGTSKEIALQRFKGMERKLLKDPTLKSEYIRFMKEYEQLGHMKERALSTVKGAHYFLPHHAVIKPDSTTTKVRVVFDASAKTSTNLSLNDILAKGPVIQDDLFTILMRFRFPRYVFTADIEKMYRQIWINEEDQAMQLIWWRDDPEAELKCYQLKTVTYGTTSAPYLAIRTLRAMADENEAQFPLATHAVRKNFYVDDVLCGSNSMRTALETQEQLRNLLRLYGFNLRKWCANHPDLLKNIERRDQEVELNFNDTTASNVKTMGLIWHPAQDHFRIKVENIEEGRITKRAILSDTARIFDPLGFMAPVTVMAKIMLQRLWALKLDWDAAVPQDMELTWKRVREDLKSLQTITIPRHVFGLKPAANAQIHIFADASEHAYGAVAYIRNAGNDTVTVRFLCAKSRVAPVNQVTLARLELCAAKVAAELFEKTQESECLQGIEPYFWSDSTAALGWINAESRSYHTFIANRIATIQRLTSPEQWRYVPSKDNPADILSRGLTPDKLVGNNFWLYGPKFLHGGIACWPLQPPRGPCTLELRKQLVTTVTTTLNSGDLFATMNHGNCFRRCQRIMAYVLRFTTLRRAGFEDTKLQSNELEEALRKIIKLVQLTEFAVDINDIKKHGAVNNSSAISSLTPFLDSDGILRVGGRLESANISYDTKHPMLLPHQHQLTKLLVEMIHKDNLHAGPQTLMAIVRQRFWPLKLKMIARSVVQHCVQCARSKPKLLQQLMGNLPVDRVQPSRPFVISGVDFFGPVWTHFKIRGKRPVKSYVAVFCCFSTKAIHMELVTDLTTEAFIGAIKRFTARRGCCKKLYCDNATNFVGARNYIQELNTVIHEDASKEKITSECSKKGIEFAFIPPRAPHFGGLWEAGVKSAKGLLQGILASAALTYEEMETVILEAESILNSRPITPLSTDPNDLQALTPGHFLIGEPLTAQIDPRAHPSTGSYPSRWKLVTQLKAEFWKRWQMEYLSSLQHRYKWKTTCQNAEPGTMVIIKDDHLPPLRWPLGRIVHVIRGNDGLVRVVDVKTATGVLRRPIHRLAPLPVNNEAGDTVDEAALSGRNRDPPPKKKGRTSSSLVTSLLIVGLMLPICLASMVEIHPFDRNPGIYYERLGTTGLVTSEWNLVTYVNMQSFWKKIQIVEEYPNALRLMCKTPNGPSKCRTTINLIDGLLTDIRMKNQVLKAHKESRKRRGAFNVVGNLANSLFGILDSEYATEAERTIEKIQTNENFLVSQIQNHTSYLDSTINVMKRNQQTMQQEIVDLEGTIGRLRLQHHQDMETQTMTEAALQAILEIMKLQKIQDDIIDLLADTHHGKISLELISPQQLGLELNKIKAQLPSDLRLPATINELLSFYKLMSIEGRITKDHIIFKLKIPLLSSEAFELLRVITVPWKENGSFYQIKSDTALLIINLHRDKYLPINHNEQNTCTLINSESYLCHQEHPLYQLGSPIADCEVGLLYNQANRPHCVRQAVTKGPHWIQLTNPNIWIYSVEDNYTVNAVCASTPNTLQLQGAGIIKLLGDCNIKQPMVTIRGYNKYSTIIHKSYIPSVNISDIADDHQVTITMVNSSIKLEEV